jgi:hypothetical protein
MSHMRKREFQECVNSLIDREAISVVTYVSQKGNPGKAYVIAPELMESWEN